MDKISIIIPVYNGEKYLDKTIRLVLEQHYQNIELILVNDGSTDESLKICNHYERVDPRVVVINKSNGGISDARNAGVALCTGKYVAFVDQDDMISSDIYLKLVSGIEKNNSDMAVSGKTMQLIDSNNILLHMVNYDYEEKNLRGADIFKEISNWDRKGAISQIWNCLYKKEIIKRYNIQFNTKLKKGQEDTLFNIEYASCCNLISFVPGNVYKYYRRKGVSTSLKKNLVYFEDFSEIVSVSVRAIRYEMLLPREKRIFQTYLLRLGVSLFRAYQEPQSESEFFCKILQEIRNNTGNIRVHSYCCKSISLIMYLKLILFLSDYGFNNLAVRLIKRK